MTATDPERLRVLETIIGPETLEDIQRLLDDLWSACDIPELVQIHTDLAAGEIGANIVEHAANGSPVRLRMEVQMSSEALRIHFTDDGRPAPVDLSRVTMPAAMSERGRGLAIAIRVLDQLSYQRDSEGNHWTLVHRLDS
ncbi:ATP-binding protein [Mycolicibacterium hodleri]|uniref:ATP-binding protein n=1 Tax=Mycolicibacterium hodleri TaxID=49897 RepID=A0A502EI52_9MYCO|nr:ATP-binding protein [Mycolicibacterium hodleri]TPG37157.1 ATP-binding protein [Mycolicibacterium hodleri]